MLHAASSNIPTAPLSQPPTTNEVKGYRRTLNGLFADDGPEEGRAGDALRLLEAFVERGDERAGPAPDLGRDGEDGIERPRAAFHQALVRVVARVEHGYEDVTTRKESVL